MLDEEEALEELEELDKDGDNQLQWQEFLESHFSYTQDELKDMQKENSKDSMDLLRVRIDHTVFTLSMRTDRPGQTMLNIINSRECSVRSESILSATHPTFIITLTGRQLDLFTI